MPSGTMLHMINTRCVARDLHTIAPSHLGVCVGGSSQRSEGIVKTWNCAIQCDNYYEGFSALVFFPLSVVNTCGQSHLR